MRRLLSLVPLLLLAGVLAACGGASAQSDATPVATDEPSATSDTPSNVATTGADCDCSAELVGIATVIETDGHESELRVAPGETVTWVNRDEGAHRLVSEDGLFEPASMEPFESFVHVFEDAGTFAIYCEIDPEMTISVIVE